jgi:hypothetical protein
LCFEIEENRSPISLKLKNTPQKTIKCNGFGESTYCGLQNSPKKIRRDPFINLSILILLNEVNHDSKSVENKDFSFDSLSFP